MPFGKMVRGKTEKHPLVKYKRVFCLQRVTPRAKARVDILRALRAISRPGGKTRGVGDAAPYGFNDGAAAFLFVQQVDVQMVVGHLHAVAAEAFAHGGVERIVHIPEIGGVYPHAADIGDGAAAVAFNGGKGRGV